MSATRVIKWDLRVCIFNEYRVARVRQWGRARRDGRGWLRSALARSSRRCRSCEDDEGLLAAPCAAWATNSGPWWAWARPADGAALAVDGWGGGGAETRGGGERAGRREAAEAPTGHFRLLVDLSDVEVTTPGLVLAFLAGVALVAGERVALAPGVGVALTSLAGAGTDLEDVDGFLDVLEAPWVGVAMAPWVAAVEAFLDS